MRRPVGWFERIEDGVKREVRVTFTSQRNIRWQAKRSDADNWEYDFPPSEEDWNRLEASMEARYQRRNAPLKDVELVKKLRLAADGAT